MDAAQVAQTEERLRALLTTAGLEWALADIDDAVQRGVVEIKYMRPRGRGTDVVAYQEVGARAPNAEKFATTRPYTAAERAELLVLAVQQVLVEVPQFANFALDTLASLPLSQTDPMKRLRSQDLSVLAPGHQDVAESIRFESEPVGSAAELRRDTRLTRQGTPDALTTITEAATRLLGELEE